MVEHLHPVGYDPQTDSARWDTPKGFIFVLAGSVHEDNPDSGPSDAKITGTFATPDLPVPGARSPLKKAVAPKKAPPTPEIPGVEWVAIVFAGHMALNDLTPIAGGDLETMFGAGFQELFTPSPAAKLTFRWACLLAANSDATPNLQLAVAVQGSKDDPDSLGWGALATSDDVPNVLSGWLCGPIKRRNWGVTAEGACLGEPGLIARVMAIPEMRVVLESDNCVDDAPGSPANTRVHPIAADPAMPNLKIMTPILGLTQAENDAVVRSHTLTVRYGNNPNWEKVIKKDNAGSEWDVDFGGEFVGGEISLNVTATLPWGDKVKGLVEGNHVIWGMNPDKSTVRGSYGDDLHYLVSVWVESRFTQFSKSAGAAALNSFQAGPRTVLRAADNGYGIGQLTNPPPACAALWDWQANVAASKTLYENKISDAQSAWNKVRAAHPEAPAWTDEELWLEVWNRYNGGKYWAWDATHHVWKVSPGSHAYATGCLARYKAALNNQFPIGWE